MLKARAPLEDVYKLRACGLGDLWAQVNYMLRFPPNVGVNPMLDNWDFTPFIRNIESQLAAPSGLNLVYSDPTYEPTYWETYACTYFRTRGGWHGEGSDTICYQFDGISEMHLKGLTKLEHAAVLDRLSSRYRVINVGGRRSLGEKVRDLEGAAGFVGVPSGMSHVANSVGLPVVVIVKEGMLKKYGGFKPYREWTYWNKPNMSFYRGALSFLMSPDFLKMHEDKRMKLIDLTGGRAIKLL